MTFESFLTFGLIFLFFVFSLFTVFTSDGKKRIVTVILASLFMFAGVNMIMGITGTPRPFAFETFIRGKKYTVLHYVMNMGNQELYVWVQKDDNPIPLYLKMPFTQESRKKFIEKAKEAKKRKTRMVLVPKHKFRKFEPSLEHFDIKYELDFPPATPEKQVEEIKPTVIK